MFRYQQIDSLLWNTDFSDRSLRFGTGERQFTIGILYILFADGDGFVLDVEVTPLERDQLALSQSADQFQIEHRQGIAPLGCVQIRADVVGVEYLHFLLLNFGDDAVFGGIAENDFFLYRPVQSIVQHHVDATHGGIA